MDPDVLRKVNRLITGTLAEDQKERESAWNELRGMGNLALPALLHLCRQKDIMPEALESALLVLSDTQDASAGPLLVEILARPEAALRRAAARALGGCNYEPAREPLEKIAADKQERTDLRLFAAVSGARLGSAACLETLAELARAAEAETRSRAIFALGKYGGVEQVPLLEAALDDADRNVREDAVEALRLRGGAPAYKGLIKATGDRDHRIRGAAMNALRQLTRESFDTPQAWRDWWATQEKRP